MTSRRHFPGYPSAISPRDLRSLLDRQPGDEDAEAVYGRLDANQRDDFDNARVRLDQVASDIFRIQPTVCEVARFIIATDKDGAADRAHAIVSRAYWRADEYARAVEQRALDAKEAQEIVLAFDCFDVETKARDAIEIFNGLRWESAPERQSRTEAMRYGLSELRQVLEFLRVFADREIKRGRSPDHGRFFLALRLAEAFAICSARSPDFDFQPNRRKRSAWIEFVSAAFALCSIGEFTSYGTPIGLDNLLRNLREYDGSEQGQRELKHDIKSLADKCGKGRRVVAGDLPSSGFLIFNADRTAPPARLIEPGSYCRE
jgi:hypothetical protein